MNRFIRWSFFLLAVLLPGSAFGQDPTEVYKLRIAPDGKPQIEVAKRLAPQFGFETRLVKGAPYSATAEAETVQVLGDGNRIRNKTTTTIYRDSEGRTRREVAGKAEGAPREIYISDPVIGITYSLNPERRVAIKSNPHVEIKLVREKRLIEQEVKQKNPEGRPPATININGQAIPWDQLTDEQRASAELKMRAAKEAASADLKGGKLNPAGPEMRKKSGTTESLGQQTIEGVVCEGKRSTVTIPADAIGNEQPLTIISEQWYSPELQVFVLTKQSDPRHGETTYRLTNINRSEPARMLFEVPAEYTIRENEVMKMKKRVREEQ